MTELVGLAAAVLLLTSVLTVWRRSSTGAVRVVAVQGLALAVLVAAVGVQRGDAAAIAVCLFVLALKGVLLPGLLARRLRSFRSDGGNAAPPEAGLLNPTATLVAAVALGVLGYAASWPAVSVGTGPTGRLAPVGVAMVLIGLLGLATRRLAVSQLVGFLVLDNGIATVGFLATGGVPLPVELASSFDVLLAVAILASFARRMHGLHGDTDVRRLRELHD